VTSLVVVGNLSIDRIGGDSRPRIGGGSYHAARGLRAADRAALVVARCADADRAKLAPQLAALGIPCRTLHGRSTAAFSFHYVGDARRMVVDALGDSWTEEDADQVPSSEWLHVAPLARSDFPAATLARLARGRRVSFDGQGLVRPGRTGPLELDTEFDPDVLRHVDVLKLADDEARALVDDIEDAGALASLGVPEVVVTYGSRGSLVLAGRRVERVPAHPLPRNPTGAGDAFAAVYLSARSSGEAPVAAARRATAAVAALLA
jgi:sugar/nucleoside kinase (ribokinase family)